MNLGHDILISWLLLLVSFWYSIIYLVFMYLARILLSFIIMALRVIIPGMLYRLISYWKAFVAVKF